jgi:hypothetical protein
LSRFSNGTRPRRISQLSETQILFALAQKEAQVRGIRQAEYRKAIKKAASYQEASKEAHHNTFDGRLLLPKLEFSHD